MSFKNIFTSLFIASISSLVSQNQLWTKEDRNNMYDDCMNYSSKYKTLNNEQKESLCLCYLEETTKKYVKSDFEAKIDIEIKRIKEAMLTQCAKNIGVDLTVQVKEIKIAEEKKPIPQEETIKGVMSKVILTGKWKTDNLSTIEFKDDGSYLEKREDNKLTSNNGYIIDGLIKGHWFLDEKGILTIRKDWQEDVGLFKVKLRTYTSSSVYKFDSFNTDYIKFTNENTGFTIQANKVK